MFVKKLSLPYSVSSIVAYLVLSMLIFTTVTSCKSKKRAIGESVEVQYNSNKLFKKIKNANTDYNWYSFKSDATAYFNGSKMSFNTDIRVKKDELIWVSVRKFGFEVGRVLIKPDSIFAIDKWNGQYVKESLDYLKKKYDVPFDFQDIQDVICGNSLIDNQKPLKATKLNENYTLMTKSKDLTIVYFLDPEFKINKSKMIARDTQSVVCEFSDYKIQDGIISSYFRKYSMPDTNSPKYSLELNLKKLSINKPQKIQFTIPESYEKM